MIVRIFDGSSRSFYDTKFVNDYIAQMQKEIDAMKQEVANAKENTEFWRLKALGPR